jgi:hypothetical protein
MRSFTQADWSEIEALRAKVAGVSEAASLVDAAQRFTALFASSFDSIILARLFVVLPFSSLPAMEQAFASRLAGSIALANATPVLCLLGSTGKKAGWNNRTASQGHLAIPLVNSTTVSEAPMIAKLLGDLEVDLKVLDDGRPIATRQMMGGRNGTFFVPDALTAQDARGRLVIAAHDFAKDFAVRSVFGMGGAYVDGTLAVAIFFCSEVLDRLIVDRFPSFISSFKMATSALLQQRRIFA